MIRQSIRSYVDEELSNTLLRSQNPTKEDGAAEADPVYARINHLASVMSIGSGVSHR